MRNIVIAWVENVTGTALRHCPQRSRHEAPCLCAILPLLASLLIQPAIAQQPTAPAEQPEQVSEDKMRDPFWPVGYIPGQKTSKAPGVVSTNAATGQVRAAPTNDAAVAQQPLIRWPDIKVKGVITQTDGTFLAIIEGVKNMVEPGQTIQIIKDGLVFRFKIVEISKKGLIQQKLDYKPAKK